MYKLNESTLLHVRHAHMRTNVHVGASSLSCRLARRIHWTLHLVDTKLKPRAPDNLVRWLTCEVLVSRALIKTMTSWDRRRIRYHTDADITNSLHDNARYDLMGEGSFVIITRCQMTSTIYLQINEWRTGACMFHTSSCQCRADKKAYLWPISTYVYCD